MAEDRRTLLKVLTTVLGGGAAAAVALPALRAVVDPVDRTTVTGAGEFVPIASLSAIPADGTPLKVPVVIAKPRDAWTKLPPTQMGAVFVKKKSDGVIAYSTICPHLGCGVDYLADKNAFACPCHESAFDSDGRVAGGPSPRPLDELEVRIADEQIEVRFQQFKQGTKEKIPT